MDLKEQILSFRIVCYFFNALISSLENFRFKFILSNKKEVSKKVINIKWNSFYEQQNFFTLGYRLYRAN